jgi:ribosomal protein S18 acetylase RimI-like enzyme
MSIYFKKANIKILISLKKGKFNSFITNALEMPLKIHYKKMTSMDKLSLIKRLILIMKNKNIIGYIWFEKLPDNTIYIKEISIKQECIIEVINQNLKIYDYFKNKEVIYEGYDNRGLDELLKSIGLIIETKSLFKILGTSHINSGNIKLSESLKIEHFIKNHDEGIRCKIQNEVFNSVSRIPLTIEDMFLDENQEYYINKYSVFLKFYDKHIGYGQIIKFNSKIYLIVNLEILDEYRRSGFGEYLLMSLIKLAKDDGIERVYIRVDINNFKAIRLYNKLGFEDADSLSYYKIYT